MKDYQNNRYMRPKLYLRTVLFLKPIQILYRIKYKYYKVKYTHYIAPAHSLLLLSTCPILRTTSLRGDTFKFLNISHDFTDWDYLGNGSLYAYNQSYFDFINSSIISEEEACKWIDKFIHDLPGIKLGMDPYPTALRCINWIKFFCKYPEHATKEREDSLWSQLCLLNKKLEYHLLGNHLLEDLFALYIGYCYFNQNKYKSRIYKSLIKQLNEQTLSDGAHYEQSPMYHCILLDRLLDCINVGRTNELEVTACKYLAWLESMCYKDNTWPFFNDSALGIAPIPTDLRAYAKRLGLSWQNAVLQESGYRKFSAGLVEAFIDCGNITATYQPGHSHADCLNYELRNNGCPIVVDTGISTYEKNSRRQYERSTSAHNCVSIDGYDSDEVWDGFRVGNRHKIHVVSEKTNYIEAVLERRGMKFMHRRIMELRNNCFIVKDSIPNRCFGISYIHLAPKVSLNIVTIKGAEKVEIIDSQYSLEYNKLINNKTLAIHFRGSIEYSIALEN